MKVRALLVAASLVVLATGACGDGDDGRQEEEGAGPLTVVASFYPLAEIAERVGGDEVRVTNLTPAGTEPHDLELTADQVDELLDADLVLYLGGGFQPAVEEIVDNREDPSLDVLADLPTGEGSAEALEEQEEAAEGGEDESEEHGAGEKVVDPHFWLDPTLMAQAVDEVAGAMSEAVPASSDVFEQSAAMYLEELDELDREFDRGLSSCARDEIVTSHAAFFYLAARYGLEQLPITGVSPEAEPDAERMAELADLIDERDITTVFSEELLSPELAETLARETGARTDVLNPIEGLDDEQIDAGATYASEMRENLAALREALGCE